MNEYFMYINIIYTLPLYILLLYDQETVANIIRKEKYPMQSIPVSTIMSTAETILLNRILLFEMLNTRPKQMLLFCKVTYTVECQAKVLKH